MATIDAMDHGDMHIVYRRQCNDREHIENTPKTQKIELVFGSLFDVILLYVSNHVAFHNKFTPRAC